MHMCDMIATRQKLEPIAGSLGEPFGDFFRGRPEQTVEPLDGPALRSCSGLIPRTLSFFLLRLSRNE